MGKPILARNYYHQHGVDRGGNRRSMIQLFQRPENVRSSSNSSPFMEITCPANDRPDQGPSISFVRDEEMSIYAQTNRDGCHWCQWQVDSQGYWRTHGISDYFDQMINMKRLSKYFPKGCFKASRNKFFIEHSPDATVQVTVYVTVGLTWLIPGGPCASSIWSRKRWLA